MSPVVLQNTNSHFTSVVASSFERFFNEFENQQDAMMLQIAKKNNSYAVENLLNQKSNSDRSSRPLLLTKNRSRVNRVTTSDLLPRRHDQSSVDAVFPLKNELSSRRYDMPSGKMFKGF